MKEKTRQQFISAIGAKRLSQDMKNTAEQIARYIKPHKWGYEWNEVLVPITRDIYIEVRFYLGKVDYVRLKKATGKGKWLLDILGNEIKGLR